MTIAVEPAGPRLLPEGARRFLIDRIREFGAVGLVVSAAMVGLALWSHQATDPSWSVASGDGIANWLRGPGAVVSDLMIQGLGLVAWAVPAMVLIWAWCLGRAQGRGKAWSRLPLAIFGMVAAAGVVTTLPGPGGWLVVGGGGALGALAFTWTHAGLTALVPDHAALLVQPLLAGLAFVFLVPATGLVRSEWGWVLKRAAKLLWWLMTRILGGITWGVAALSGRIRRRSEDADEPVARKTPEWAEAHSRTVKSWLSDMMAKAGRLAPRPHSADDGDAPLEPVIRREPLLRAEPSFDRRTSAVSAAATAEPTPPEPTPLEALAGEGSEPEEVAEFGVDDARDYDDVDDGFDDDTDPPWDLQDLDIDAAVMQRVAVAPPVVVSEKDAIPAAMQEKLGVVGERQDRGAAGLSKRSVAEKQPQLALEEGYRTPPLELLSLPNEADRPAAISKEALAANAQLLEGVLKDFGIKGEIVKVNPGPVVTLYELEPAPGTKSSRVIGLADDIARSMSAISVRVAVVPGRNVIGIELPNAKRETVFFREIAQADQFDQAKEKLALILGKDIGGTSVLADLARMPHLLVAGTTGSGKSVAINTMILSLLYRLPPEKVRFIMVDPKMLELSIYDGIPHLLSPVVTDPKKAVVALKWTVREMEDRYRAMSKMGVRNIEGYNQRLRDAKAKGETLTRRVQTGFDPDTGKPVFEEQPIDLTELPYIVVVVDEMADLMLVAGKDIEAAIQRLAQMARAAGIHLIMATQRPSVDVITGTIKANFPTRISFQVSSKIDSRTILGEGGAEQLLGQGDMLYMAGGGRVTRVHGPFVKDEEVEAVVRHLRTQGEPDYNEQILEDPDEGEGGDGADATGGGSSGGGGENELYDKAVALVAREKKASTSFIQRHLQIGYNRAARLIEQMEKEGVVSSANHVGRREVLIGER